MEIEIKATFEDKEAIKKKLTELGATLEGTKHQVDTYYNHPSRDTRKTNEYIRLREKPNEKQGVFAHHINVADGVNKELETSVDNVAVFKQILENFGFAALGVIDKKRETYIFGEYKITFDDVKDIGNFLEIETEGEKNEVDEKKAACIEILQKLGLSKKDLCKGVWLCDIATGRMKWPQKMNSQS